MGNRGPAKKPSLQIVREGNQGHHAANRLDSGVKLPPARPEEPEWLDWFAAGPTPKVPRKRKNETEDQRKERESATEYRERVLARSEWECASASALWSHVLEILDPAGVVTKADRLILVDLVVTWVRIQQAELDVSAHGLRQWSERGYTRNGSITTAMQYRTHWKWLCAQLGLSPVARDGMNPEAGDDEDSPFDI